MLLKQLRYLSEIAKTGSFNKAAKSLYVSQPNITKVVKELEEELKTELFFRNRKSKNIVFTPAGEELLEYAKYILEEIDLLKNKFLYKSLEKKSIFAISTQHYSFVSDVFIEFFQRELSNHFEFILREGKTKSVIQDIITHKSDIGILGIVEEVHPFTKKYLSENNIDFFSLKIFKNHIFVRKNHPLARKEKVFLEDLEKFPAVVFEQEVNPMNFCNDILYKKHSEKLITVSDRDTIYNIILHTDAYNIGTGFFQKNIYREEIKVIPLSDSLPNLNVGWIKLKNTIVDDRIKLFVELCKTYLSRI